MRPVMGKLRGASRSDHFTLPVYDKGLSRVYLAKTASEPGQICPSLLRLSLHREHWPL